MRLSHFNYRWEKGRGLDNQQPAGARREYAARINGVKLRIGFVCVRLLFAHSLTLVPKLKPGNERKRIWTEQNYSSAGMRYSFFCDFKY